MLDTATGFNVSCVMSIIQDCDTAPYTDREEGLPAASLGYDDLMEYFAREFDFTPRQVSPQ